MMPRSGFFATMITMIASFPAFANEKDCLTGAVTFATAGAEVTLTLDIHDRKLEVPKGLFRIAELPTFGGVFSIYPEPRESRSLANSDVLPADLMSFDAAGKALSVMEDQTGVEVDRMESGDGMLYAAYLAGGTVKAKGFDSTTIMKGWTCLKEK